MTLDGGSAAPVAPIALTTAYRNAGNGSADGVKTCLFAESVPLTPGKLAVSGWTGLLLTQAM